MVYTGIDNIDSARSLLKDARIGLMTNPTGRDAYMRSTIDVLQEKYCLTALFACEHGVRGCAPAGEKIETFKDEKTGVPVFSCYGGDTHLSEEMLDAFDVFVFDIQDAGARFYTFIYSLSDAMVSCAAAGKPVLVLDRPNPLGGHKVQGTLLEERYSSFVGRYPIPTRHGLTAGEFAQWVNKHAFLNLDLHIAPMTGWKRSMDYADTGLFFVPPSPNLSTLHAARVYTGTCLFEGTNISEGRGTALPFELIGAPFIDGEKLAERMNKKHLPGVFFRDAFFTPNVSKYAGNVCSGVQIYVTDAEVINPPLIGLLLMDEIRCLYPGQFEFRESIDRLLGTDDYRLGRLDGPSLIEKHRPLLERWQQDARDILLY